MDKGRLFNPNTPLNPNLDNFGPWKLDKKSPRQSNEKKLLNKLRKMGKTSWETPPQNKKELGKNLYLRENFPLWIKTCKSFATLRGNKCNVLVLLCSNILRLCM